MRAAPFSFQVKDAGCRPRAPSFPCNMSKSQTIIFNCPSCEAEYRIVSIEAPSDVMHGKIACLKCDALFPAGEGRVFFKYFLVGRPSGRSSKRK
jgi:predicted Zn finger-like uncharacterized protein